MDQDVIYMQRCLQLALLGSGKVAPNPMVGAVLVFDGRIIGEGYHAEWGKAHAEVECINSVKSKDLDLIEKATLYVSLEPCAHFGKTPPCADLILQKKIPKVVIGCRDPFAEVNGKGIERLTNAGVDVITGILEGEALAINKRFFHFHQKHRPYIILKWAQSQDRKIGGKGERIFISNDFTNRLVHQWRSEEMSILVGTNTALFDDPELTTRLWPGRDPKRMVVDLELKLPKNLNLFSGGTTLVFNLHQHSFIGDQPLKAFEKNAVQYYKVSKDGSLVQQISRALYQLNIQSLIVEGGAQLLQSFIDENLWDEARVITNNELIIGEGVDAPLLQKEQLIALENIHSDSIHTYIQLSSE